MKKKFFDLNSFKAYITYKKVICYGAGLQGKRAIIYFDNWGISDNVLFFVDGNPLVNRITYGGLEYPVLTINEMIERIDDDCFIIITCMQAVEVESLLNGIESLENVPYTTLACIAEKELIVSNYDTIIEESIQRKIPKRIHYCWFGGKKNRDVTLRIESWKKMCPEYEIIEWNDKNYDVSKNTYCREAYDNGEYAFVSDYCRLDVVYQYGGIYLDIDVEIAQKPDKLLFQGGFMSVDATMLVNLGSGFGAIEKNALIKEMRDDYNDARFSLNEGKLDRTPCTTRQYACLMKHGYIVNDSFQTIGDINIYPMIFQGTCGHTRKLRRSDKVFFYHYGTMYWDNNGKWKAAMNSNNTCSTEEDILESYAI